jgi:16S rRNA (uracil1498-N3)-methyltransferase
MNLNRFTISLFRLESTVYRFYRFLVEFAIPIFGSLSILAFSIAVFLGVVSLTVARFYCESIEGPVVLLGGEQGHHLAHVMRGRTGSTVEIFDGKGTVARATVVDVGRKVVSLKIEKTETFSPPSAGRVIIAASVAKVHRFEQLITQCSELGAEHIAAVVFARTVKLAAGKNAGLRYSKLAIAAAKQSGRIFLPEITGPDSLEKTIALLKDRYPDAKIIFGSFSESAIPAGQVTGQGSDIIAFVGPEGGMTEDEEKLLIASGGVRVKLTDTILRIETAAAAFAAILCAGKG